MRGSGGTDGGVGMFLLGALLAGLGIYFFLDSVNVTTGASGFFSGMIRGRAGGHGLVQTTSMGIIFVPFIIAVTALFYNAKMTWAWILLYFGLAIIIIEILSHIRFEMRVKVTHILLMFVLFSAGTGLILRSYRSLK